MSLAFSDSDHGADSSGGTVTTLDATAVTVAAGDLVVAWAKHEGTGSTTLSVATSAGADTFQAGTLESHSATNDLHGQFHYLLSATSTGTVTYRLTLGAGKPYVSLHIWVFTPDAGDTVTFVDDAVGQGDSSTPTSGAIDLGTGDDFAAVFGYGEYSAQQMAANPTINGVAVAGSYRANGGVDPDGNFTASGYRLVTTPFAAGTAVGSIAPTSANWLMHIIGFKSASGGAPATWGPLLGLRNNRLVVA